MLALLFLCSFLDRTNVGNAKIYGLEKDLNINDQQYDIGLTVFYLTYICRYGYRPAFSLLGRATHNSSMSIADLSVNCRVTSF